MDAENRLAGVETRAAAVAAGAPKVRLSYAYDHQSRRIAKARETWDGSAWQTTGASRFLYDGWNVIAELTYLQTHTHTNLYTWGLDLSGSLQGAGGIGGLLAGVLAKNEEPGARNLVAYAPDANGNVMQLVDATDGTLAAAYEYSPFGETVVSTGPLAKANPFRFSTKWFDNDTGLGDWGYRWYCSGVGRWLNRDPAEERAGRAIYVWSANDGILRIDGLGLACQRTHGEGINWRAEAALYEVFGGLASVGVSGTLYDCCCDSDIIPLDAYEVTIEGKASVGFGLGAHIVLPVLGRVGYLIQGPQFSWSQSVSLVKECGEPNPSIVVTLADVSGNIGGAASFGSTWGVSAGYWSNYGISMNLVIADRTASIVGTLGWQGGGEWEVNTPVVNLHGELLTFDYTHELQNDVYIQW